MYTDEVHVSQVGSPVGVSFFSGGMLVKLFFLRRWRGSKLSKWSLGMLSKRGKGSVGGGEAGKKAKTTPDAGGKSVSEKSQATRTSK